MNPPPGASRPTVGQPAYADVVHPKVLVVVASFKPDREALLALTSGLAALSLPVLVVDDASPCTTDAVLRELAAGGATVIRHRRNAGIARSLNDGLRLASSQGATWLLTVDQDSVLAADHFDLLLAEAERAAEVLGPDRVGAVAAGTIDDASGEIGYPVTWCDGVATTEEVIQTGTLWSVPSLLEFGGFDERLGIDAVDAAACLRMRQAGRVLVLAPELSIAHRIGSGRQVRLLGRNVLVSGHSPERRATILRNRLRLFPAEFAQSPVHALRTIRRVGVQTALAVTIEDNRWAKVKASARGLIPRGAGGGSRP